MASTHVNIYNTALKVVACSLRGLARNGQRKKSKIRKFALAQQQVMHDISTAISMLQPREETYWFHASSMGEWNILRPILEHIRQKRDVRIILTFFSPTGYEYLSRKGHEAVDAVFYLPLDTKDNARRFLDIIHPSKAVFAVSELWPNYMNELTERGIPSFLISCLYREDASYNKWYGGLFRQTLHRFGAITTVTAHSTECLQNRGCQHVYNVGDPLFDNAISVANAPYENPIIEQFASDHDVFVAGSVHSGKDMKLIAALANAHPEVRFIIVPHETRDEAIAQICQQLNGETVRYSQCQGGTDPGQAQNLIIDFVGSLAYIYRYAKWAYVGGGFTRYLHSVVEASVYGIPVSFGPIIRRTSTPPLLIERQLGWTVRNEHEILQWFGQLQATETLADIKTRATAFVQEQRGASGRIAEMITA